MMLDAVIFDMDGLMVDTEPLSRAAWERVVAPFGGTIDDALYQAMLGHRTVESAGMVLDRWPIPLTVEALVARKSAAYLDILSAGVPAMPGLHALIDSLDAHGLPWAVATSTPREVALFIIGELGLLERCGAIAAGDEVTHGKPAPDIYLLAAERLGVDPARCLALEDTSTGCRAAAAAGMAVIAVPGEWSATADFGCAAHLAGSLVDVPTLIANGLPPG